LITQSWRSTPELYQNLRPYVFQHPNSRTRKGLSQRSFDAPTIHLVRRGGLCSGW
jgi:hypothetical protein